MKNLISSVYFTKIIQYPLLSIITLVLLLIVCTLQLNNFRLDASADTLILENDKDLMIYRSTMKTYSTQDFIILTITPNASSIFDYATLNIIKSIKEDLENLDGVASINSIIDVPLIESSDLPISEMIENVPTILSKNVSLDKARAEITQSPVYKNLIISEDSKTTAIQVNIKENSTLLDIATKKSDLLTKIANTRSSDREIKELEILNKKYDSLKLAYDKEMNLLLKEIRQIRDYYTSKNNLEIRIGGIPMIIDDMVRYVKNDLINFGVGVFMFIFLTLTIIFRKIRWVLLPILSCIYSVLFMMGILSLLGWKVTVISSNFISLMLILTLSMNIHIIVRYRQLSREISDHMELVKTSASKMVWPCFYTALTTIVAFASLIFSDIKPVIDFGYMMVMGLTVTFFTSFILLPCLILIIGPETSILHKNQISKKFFLTRYLAEVSIHQGKMITAFSLFLLFVSIYGTSLLKVENSFINYFKSDTEIYKGMKQIDDKLGGTTPLDIIIKFDDEVTDDEVLDSDLFDDEVLSDDDLNSNWFTTKKIDKIKSVHDYLDTQPEIGKVMSLASTIRVAEKINDNKELTSLELALLYKRAPNKVKKIAVDPYISIENNEARINVRILDSDKDLRRKELIDRIEFDITNVLDIPPSKVTITGILILYNNMLQSLFSSQILSLGFVMLGIFIMFIILFKSLMISLIGIVPNLLAATSVLGLMGLIGLPLDMMTITVAAITVGIAVDNSIHYIYRFREEYYKTRDYTIALKDSHDSIGRAIFFTGITIIFGFSILILSNFVPTIIFGLLTGLAMLIALLAVLTLLPKLILFIKPFGKIKEY